MMNFKNQKKSILLCFFALTVLGLAFIYFFSNTKTESTVRKHLNILTLQERTSLHNFFKMPVFTSGFGYTIFGEKPMSIITTMDDKKTKNFDRIDYMAVEHIRNRNLEGIDYMAIEHIFAHYRFWENWEVWHKYSHLFPLNGFAIIKYDCPPYNLDLLELTVINEKYFIQTVNEHLSDFHSVIGRPLTPNQILDEYLKGEGEVFLSIQCHDGLLGTLLGYGRDNAWEFMRRSGGKTMDALIEVEDIMHARDVLPAAFKVIGDSDETIKLRIRYAAEQEKLNKIYQSDDFLEQVLNKLTGTNG